MLRPAGRVVADLDPPGTGSGYRLLRLHDARGRRSPSLPWAHVSVDDIAALAGGAGMRTATITSHPRPGTHEDAGQARRWFAVLTADA
ncbi:MAG: hypothetical protein V9G19_23895 [Tetrasphaera sp.]